MISSLESIVAPAAAIFLGERLSAVATDACVPISRLAECVEAAQRKADELGLICPIVGHVGDGNFHTLPLIDMENPEEIAKAEGFVSWLAELAISMDGTCTGEHGIGTGKRAYMEAEHGEGWAVMRAIKAALDPLGIMNPGKLV